jgi:hypothetical protein
MPSQFLRLVSLDQEFHAAMATPDTLGENVVHTPGYCRHSATIGTFKWARVRSRKMINASHAATCNYVNGQAQFSDRCRINVHTGVYGIP